MNLGKDWVLISVEALMVLVMLASAIFHFYRTDTIPYGYHVDELSQAVTVECIAKEGVDAHNNHYPLFFQTNYGSPRPPTSIYPAILWGDVQGFTVPSLRNYGVAVHLLGIVGIYFLGRLFFGHFFGLCAAFAASVSPWLWPTSRVAIESLFSPTFSIWAMYFFFRRQNYFHWSLAALLFCASMYNYPAMRLQVPIMLVTLGIYAFRTMKTSFALWIVFILSFVLPLIPLGMQILHGGAVHHRFSQISITSAEYLSRIGKTHSFKDLWDIFWGNYGLHLTPDFLLLRGDPSLVHSVGHFGILSWLDLGALIFCALTLLWGIVKPKNLSNPWSKDSLFLVFLLANILLAIIPAALTNSELPHALRIDGGWPFLCLLTGYFMYRWWHGWKPLFVIGFITGVLFLMAFVKAYFGPYQEQSKGMFSYWTKEQADAAKTEEDWNKFMLMYNNQDYHFRYFLMNYRSDTCTSTRLKWEKQRDLLISLNMYHQ